jgi:hypothetical protein
METYMCHSQTDTAKGLSSAARVTALAQRTAWHGKAASPPHLQQRPQPGIPALLPSQAGQPRPKGLQALPLAATAAAAAAAARRPLLPAHLPCCRAAVLRAGRPGRCGQGGLCVCPLRLRQVQGSLFQYCSCK